MKKAVAQCVRNAFGAESAAHMRYLIFSGRAESEGFPNIARLFRALAFAARVRASGLYRQTSELLGEYCVSYSAPFIDNRTMDNLKMAWETEKDESVERYPPSAAAARQQGEARVAKDLEAFGEAKYANAALARKALEMAEHDAADPAIGELHVCRACGLVVEGGPCDCPSCKPGEFERIS